MPQQTISRRRIIAGASAALGLSLLPGCGLQGRNLLAADSQPDGYPTVEALKFFARRLEERTGGRLKTTVYPSEQLGSQNDTLELAQFGGLDFIRLNIAPLNVLVPETIVPALPFLFRSIEHMRRALDGAPGRKILASLEPHGLIGLAFYDSGARSFYTRDRPIRTPEDLAGLKIRVQTSDLFVSMVEALGGDATPMAYGEVYQGLVQGVIDGAENNFPSFESSRHYEVAKIYSLTRHVMAPEVMAMSRRSWEKLDAGDQQHVLAAAQESVPYMRKLWDQRVIDARKVLVGAGAQIIDDIDTRPFARRVEGLWSEYLVTPAMRNLVADIEAMDTGTASEPEKTVQGDAPAPAEGGRLNGP